MKTLISRIHRCLAAGALLALVIPAAPALTAQSEAARLTPSVNGSLRFGYASAVDGDVMVVGDPAAPSASIGAAFVYVKDASGWAGAREVARLTPSDGSESLGFGRSVAIDGDTIVIGANFGNCYVFSKTPAGWVSTTESAKLRYSQPDWLGETVAIDGDTVVIGSTLSTVAALYVKPAAGWTTMTETATLRPTSTVAKAFGYSIDVRRDTVLIGDPEDGAAKTTNEGAAYIFVKPSTGWADMTETAMLTVANRPQIEVGIDVALTPTAAVVGTINGSGQAFVFERPATGWTSMTETAVLTRSGGSAISDFGLSIDASDDDTVVVGDRTYVENMKMIGAVYVFHRPTSGWVTTTEDRKLTVLTALDGDRIGQSVAIADDAILAGSRVAATSAPYAAVFHLTTLTESGSTSVGGTRILSIDAPQAAGRIYQAASAISAGTQVLGERRLGLAQDGVWAVSVTDSAPTVFENYRGQTDAAGRATAKLNLLDVPETVGLTVYSACVTVHPAAPGGILGISNTTSFVITQ